MIVAVMSALAEPTRLEGMRFRAAGSQYFACVQMCKLGLCQSWTRRCAKTAHAERGVDRRYAPWLRNRMNSALSLPVAHLVDVALGRDPAVRKAAA
jgi:ArsR family transcriptional regulator